MKKIAIFGLSANPPANHHLLILQRLTEAFGRVVIIPRGTDPNKPSTTETTVAQRKEMIRLAFPAGPNIEVDFYDLDNDVFTPTWKIDKRYRTKFSDAGIWHAVGGDIVKDGAGGNSQIQQKWRKGIEIWDNLNWAVIAHPDLPVKLKDLPPHSVLIEMPAFGGRSTIIRNRIAADQSISDLVPPAVERYIIDNDLYKN